MKTFMPARNAIFVGVTVSLASEREREIETER